MERKMQSLKLMEALRPFLQGGIITSKEAGEIVDEFNSANGSEKLERLINSPTIPMTYERCISRLKQFS